MRAGIISVLAIGLFSGTAFAALWPGTLEVPSSNAQNSTLRVAQQNQQQKQLQQPQKPVLRPQQPVQMMQRPVQTFRPATTQMPNSVAPNNRQVPNRMDSVGTAGVSNRMNGPAGMSAAPGMAQTPRGQLQQLVRPVGMPAALPPKIQSPTTAAHLNGPRATTSKSNLTQKVSIRANQKISFRKPANVRHNPNHLVGHAGLRHHHQPFFFRRAGLFYHRDYYVLGGVWYWYDAPIVEETPEYAEVVEMADLPTCDDEVDECQ